MTDTTEGTDGRPKGGLGRSTAVFSFWTAVSRVAGLAREVVAAALFGTQGAINAFVIAFQVPNLLRSLVADSAISAAFVPIYTQLQEQGRKQDARRLVGALSSVIVLGLSAISLVAILTAPWVMPLLAPGLDSSLQHYLISLSQVMFPIVPLLGLTGIVAAVLGVIKTMGSITEPPAVLGAMIGSALVGTFLGVFLAYGLVGPFAVRLTSIIEEESAFYRIIQSVLVAHLHGNAAQISVEIGRGSVPTLTQPSFTELEEALQAIPPEG